MTFKKTCFIRVRYPNGYDTIEQAFQLNEVMNPSYLKRAIKSNLKTDSLTICGSVLYNHKTNFIINVITGSLDLNYLSYYSVFSKTMANKENLENLTIENLKEMSIEFFKVYMEKNGSIPKVIIFYRNGLYLNDGKLITHRTELQLLKKAFAELNGDFVKPSITFIVITNNPGTIYYNFFDSQNKCLPDGLATEPLFSIEQSSYTREFYLSCNGNIECRPYRYRIIIDENYLQQEIIMDLTYKLCFVFLPCFQKFDCPCSVLYSNFVGEKLSNNQLTELDKELTQGILKRLDYIELSSNLINYNSRKESGKRNNDCLTTVDDLAKIYLINDPYEEENDSISSFFDTVTFLISFFIFFGVIFWASQRN